MQHSRHPAPAACRAPGPNAGGAVAVAAPAAGSEPAPEPAVPQNTALSWSFPGSALDVSLSRRWLAAAVEQAWGAGDDADRVVLAYSEVATNAVVHGAGPVTVRTSILDGAVTCEVADCSARAPRPRHAADDDVRGRGLDLVAMTVDRFRVDLGEGGKTVSFEVGRRLGARTGSGRSPLGRSGPGPAGERAGAASEPEPAKTSEPGSGAGSGTGLLKKDSAVRPAARTAAPTGGGGRRAGESGGDSSGGGGAA